MVAPAGEAGQPYVALDHGDLGLARDAGKPQPCRHLAFVHDAMADQVGVGGVLHDQRAEVAAIGQRPAHDRGVHHRAATVGEADRAGILEEAELGHLAAAQPLGQRGGGIDAHLGLVAGASGDEIDQRDVVDDRVGVGHGDDGGDAAGGRRLSGGSEGLAVLGAGLADEDAHVDQARRDDGAAAVDHLGVGRARRLHRLRPGGDDAPVGNDHRAWPHRDCARDRRRGH